MIHQTSDLCARLHPIIREGKRFNFTTGYKEIPLNSIYILFEKSEEGHGGDRIVRIGTHRVDNRLQIRLDNHFIGRIHNSILRKNIGLCFSHRKSKPNLDTQNLDTASRENRKPKAEIEKEISSYIQNNFSFCVLHVPFKEARLHYEARLIGTVSTCKDCHQSQNWLGLDSPIEQIRECGLWQKQHLYAAPLSEEELTFISDSLIRK